MGGKFRQMSDIEFLRKAIQDRDAYNDLEKNKLKELEDAEKARKASVLGGGQKDEKERKETC